MQTDITIKIGGGAGQGIQTIGSLLSQVCHSAGLFIFSINDFESRIRGGHSFNLIRISNKPVVAPGNKIDILVALDQITMDLNKDNLLKDGMIVLNSDTDVEFHDNIFKIPLQGLAKEAGGVITANTIAAGAVLSFLDAPFKILKELLSNRFKKKGTKIVNLNLTAAQKGYAAAGEVKFHKTFSWKPEQTNRLVINGAKAAALGALASDCRFFPFYPMSPATGIISNIVPFSNSLPVVVEQAEA